MQLVPWIELIELLNSIRLKSKYPFFLTQQPSIKTRRATIFDFMALICGFSTTFHFNLFFICIAIRFEFCYFKEFEIYWFDISINSTNDWQFIGQLLEQNILFACNSESDQMRVSWNNRVWKKNREKEVMTKSAIVRVLCHTVRYVYCERA